MLTPLQFDEKMNELRLINTRIKSYTTRTPMKTVSMDINRAKELYDEITRALDELQDFY